MQVRSKSYVVNAITLELRYKKYVRITLGSYVRFTFGNCVKKPCKWEQKDT